MRAYEFINKKQELHYILEIKKSKVDSGEMSIDTWLTLMEQHHYNGKKFIKESVDQDAIEDIKNLAISNVPNPVVGERYIPIPVSIFGFANMFYDVNGNNPPKNKASFLTLVKYDGDSIILADDQRQYTWPFDHLRPLSYTTVILCSTVEAYDKLRVWIRLKYDVELLPCEEDLDEDISRRGFLGGVGAAAVGAASLAPQSTQQGTLTPQQIAAQDAKKAEMNRRDPATIKNALVKQATAAGITGVELRQLLSQAQHETLNFMSLVELPPRGLSDPESYFTKKYDPHPKFGNPRIAKKLGNTELGDGAKYKGRGHLHITGRYNYGIVGRGIGKDLINNPRLLENPDIGALASIWWWNNRVKPRVSDFGNVKQVTKGINPGETSRGMKSRIKKFLGMKK